MSDAPRKRSTAELIEDAKAIVDYLTEHMGVVEDSDANLLVELDHLADDIPTKVEALWHASKRLAVERELLQEEYRRLRDMADAKGKARERVGRLATELLQSARDLGIMEANKRTQNLTLKTGTMTAWLQSTVSVEGPEAPEEWPAKWRSELTTTVPNKTKAREDIEAGATSELVRLVTREGARWR